MDKDQRDELLKKDFFAYVNNPRNVFAEHKEGVTYRCPCCGYKTLGERGGYEICPVCFWEDDGQDEDDAGTNRFFGPNHMSLAQAREHYRDLGAVDERSLQFVRPPLPEEMD